MALQTEILSDLIGKGQIYYPENGIAFLPKKDQKTICQNVVADMCEMLSVGDYEGIVTNRTYLDTLLDSVPMVDRDKLRGAVVKPWLMEVLSMTENVDGGYVPTHVASMPIFKDGTASQELFEATFDIFERMSKFKSGVNPHVAFDDVEMSMLFGVNGPLKLRDSKDRHDSAYQQSRLMLLGMKRLNADEIWKLFSFASWERSSRAKMGRLGAGMSRTLANNYENLTPSERNALYTMSLKCWGNPGGGVNDKNISHSQKITRYKRAKRIVLAGGEIPINYGLSKRSEGKLKKLYEEIHPGWSSPLRKDDKGKSWLNHKGQVVSEVRADKVVFERPKPKMQTQVTLALLRVLGMFVS